MRMQSFIASPDPRYRFLRQLGSGSYGSVAAFRDSESSTDVAMKRIPQALDDFLVCRRTLRELKLMRHFHHRNLLHLIDILPIGPRGTQHGQVYVVTPLMDMDLDQVLRKRLMLLSAGQVCSFLAQMLLGLLHLHSGHVIHRDLKPANVFLRRDGLLKIGDLGLSRGIDLEEGSGEAIHPFDEALTEYVVTRWYRAPEVILMPSEYGPPVDVWSVGCILYEMVTGKVLFQGRSSFDQLKRIFAVLGTPSTAAPHWRQHSSARKLIEQVPPCRSNRRLLSQGWSFPYDEELARLLNEMLAFEPDARPSLEQALHHPYLEGVRSVADIAKAKDVTIFPQDYDKEYDGMSPKAEKQLLPEVVQLLRQEVEQFRSTRRKRASTPPSHPMLRRSVCTSATDASSIGSRRKQESCKEDALAVEQGGGGSNSVGPAWRYRLRPGSEDRGDLPAKSRPSVTSQPSRSARGVRGERSSATTTTGTAAPTTRERGCSHELRSSVVQVAPRARSAGSRRTIAGDRAVEALNCDGAADLESAGAARVSQGSSIPSRFPREAVDRPPLPAWVRNERRKELLAAQAEASRRERERAAALRRAHSSPVFVEEPEVEPRRPSIVAIVAADRAGAAQLTARRRSRRDASPEAPRSAGPEEDAAMDQPPPLKVLANRRVSESDMALLRAARAEAVRRERLRAQCGAADSP